MANKYVIDKENNIAKIELRRYDGNNVWTTIDLDDLEKVLNFPASWHSMFEKNIQSYYAVATLYIDTNTNPTIYLQKFLLNPENDPKIRVDHISHDTLDNRRTNLRTSTNDENTKHRKGRNSNNKTGYRNVSYIKSHKSKPYWVQIMIDGKNTVLGKFDDVDEAGVFAEEMREKYYGEFKGKG